MKYNTNSVMSLEDIAFTKIAITLCSCSDITLNILNNYRSTQEWIILENIMNLNSNLQLPEVLKVQLDQLCSFIGFEVFKFVDYLSKKISLDDQCLKYCLSEFSWKTNGIIDAKKTAEILIEEPTIDLLTRYKLACSFCLKEDILKLWLKLPVDQKSFFISESNQSEKYLNSSYIWSLYNEKQETLLSTKSVEQGIQSVYLYNFLCSVHEGVLEAAMYHWQKIPHEEKLGAISEAMIMIENHYAEFQNKENSCGIVSTFYIRSLGEVAVFLYTQASDEEIEILEEELTFFIFRVLTCFLEWPFLKCFIKTFESLQRILKMDDYIEIIKLIESKILFYHEWADESYQFILKEVWTISSETNKESIYSFLPSLISTLLIVEDEELLFFILNDLPILVREGLCFSNEGISECIALASNQAWRLFEIIVETCVRQEKLEYFKSLLENKIQANTNLSDSSKMQHDTAFHMYNFLDNVFEKCDSKSPPLKKLCSDVKF